MSGRSGTEADSRGAAELCSKLETPPDGHCAWALSPHYIVIVILLRSIFIDTQDMGESQMCYIR